MLTSKALVLMSLVTCIHNSTFLELDPDHCLWNYQKLHWSQPEGNSIQLWRKVGTGDGDYFRNGGVGAECISIRGCRTLLDPQGDSRCQSSVYKGLPSTPPVHSCGDCGEVYRAPSIVLPTRERFHCDSSKLEINELNFDQLLFLLYYKVSNNKILKKKKK